MKNFNFYFLISLLALTITFTSCEKESDNKREEEEVEEEVVLETNEGIFDNDIYLTDSAFIYYWGENDEHDGYFNTNIYIADTGVIYHEDNDFFSGKGVLIELSLTTSSETNLAAGTYNFSDSRSPFSIYDGYITFHENNTNTIPWSRLITSGNVIVTKEGEETTIVYDLKTLQGYTLRGNYTGTFKERIF